MCGGQLDKQEGKYQPAEPRRAKRPKPKKRRSPGVRMKGSAVEALQQEAAIRKAAGEEWLTLETRVMHCNPHAVTLHWMFNDAATGRRVLDYWPGNGKWRCPADGTTGMAAGPHEALQEACNRAPALLPA